MMVHLDWAGERNGLADMLFGAFHERGGGAALIIGCDGRVPSLADRYAQGTLLQIG